MTLSGLGPRELSDLPNMKWAKDDEKKAQDLAIQRFIKESHRSYDAREAGNVQQADDYQRRAWAWMRWGGVPPDRFAEAVAMAAQGTYTSVLNRTKDDFYNKHVSPQNQEAFRTGYQKTLQNRYGTQ
jgi:hypothetical protein